MTASPLDEDLSSTDTRLVSWASLRYSIAAHTMPTDVILVVGNLFPFESYAALAVEFSCR